MEDFFAEKHSRAERKGDCSQASARYASCSFDLFIYFYFGIPVYIPLWILWLFFFEKLFLLIGVDIEDHFICVVESKFAFKLALL